MEIIEAVFEQVVRYAILFMEVIGVIVMVLTAVKAVVGICKRDEHMRLNLAEGIALALEFKLGGEVLRTLIVRSLDELAMLGAVVLVRAAITVLIQWGIKNEESRLDEVEREQRIPHSIVAHAIKRKRRFRSVPGAEPCVQDAGGRGRSCRTDRRLNEN